MQALEGQKLVAVTFVVDYLQLQFEGARMTVYVWPTMIDAEHRYERSSQRYCDRMCSLIGEDVLGVSEEADVAITLSFATGVHLRIPLGYEFRDSAEALMLETNSGEWNVW